MINPINNYDNFDDLCSTDGCGVHFDYISEEVFNTSNNELNDFKKKVQTILEKIVRDQSLVDLENIIQKQLSNIGNNNNGEHLRLFQGKLILVAGSMENGYFVNGEKLLNYKEYIATIELSTIPSSILLKSYLSNPVKISKLRKPYNSDKINHEL